MLKREERRARDALNHLTRAIAFLMEDRTYVCRDYGNMASLDAFQEINGTRRIIAINKGIGSELIFLWTAADELRSLLETSRSRGCVALSRNRDIPEDEVASVSGQDG